MKGTVAIITNLAGYTKESSLGDYSWLLARRLKKNGYKVYYYCKNDFLNDDERDAEIEMRVFPNDFWENVRKSLNRENIKVCIFQYLPSIWGYKGMPFNTSANVVRLSLSGKRVITTFHETWTRLTFNRLTLTLQSLVQRLAAAVIAFFSKRVITSIDRYKRQLSVFNHSTYIIPVVSNIVDVDVPDAELEALRGTYVQDEAVLIGSFGNRDHSRLVLMLKTLLEKGLKAKLLLIGDIDPVAIKRIESVIEETRLQDKVIFTGSLSNRDVYKHLRVLDLYILLEKVVGKNQGGGTFKSGSLVAAFAAGQAIISTKGDMNNKDFENGNVPIVLFGNEDEANFKTLIRLVTNSEEREELKRKTREYFLQHLSTDVITQKYMQVIDSVI